MCWFAGLLVWDRLRSSHGSRRLPRFAFLMTIQFASYKALCSSCPKAFLCVVCSYIYYGQMRLEKRE